VITVRAQAPLILGGWQSRLTPNQYTHVINAVGGFESANIVLADLGDWLANGLGRHIETYNPALGICWEGFVNQVDIVYGNLTVTRGPFLGTTNRLNAVYSTVDTTVIPPTEGIEAETGWLDDLASQAVYGVLPAVISVGETNPADALAIARSYLAHHSLPLTTQTFAAAPVEPSVIVQCLGYRHWLFYVYNQLVNVGLINTDAKIVDILTGTDAATGNPYNLNSAWLPFDTTYVETPGAVVQVPRYEYEDRTAWELIQGLTARGDANQNRWLFGIYEGRQARYGQAPTTVEYTAKLSDPAQQIYAGGPVDPWDVRPGRWLEFEDFDPGYYPPTLEEDPRAMFIESVTYTMPNQLALSGDPVSSLSDVMASFGLGGVGV